MLLGDESDAKALWLTPSEVGGTVFQCQFGQWSQTSSGVISAKCGNRSFRIIVEKNAVPSVITIDVSGDEPYPAYVLSPCELNE